MSLVKFILISFSSTYFQFFHFLLSLEMICILGVDIERPHVCFLGFCFSSLNSLLLFFFLFILDA